MVPNRTLAVSFFVKLAECTVTTSCTVRATVGSHGHARSKLSHVRGLARVASTWPTLKATSTVLKKMQESKGRGTCCAAQTSLCQAAFAPAGARRGALQLALR